jgi:carbamoyl-phosphate synthase large subunit
MQKTKVKKVLVLGSGALKIGQAGEFDYSGSQAIKALKEEGVETVLINPNIATVQTDEGLADKVYFLPVTPYFVRRVIKKEKPDSIALSFGGQTALNCGLELEKQKVFEKYSIRVLGTSVESILATEDRDIFRQKLQEIQVEVPRGKAIANSKQGIDFAKHTGYPVFVRLGYALGGQGSGIAKTEKQLQEILDNAFRQSPSVLIEEYLEGWKEVEYEMMRDSAGNCIAICNMENIDSMGIHTGESIVVAPSQTLTNTEYHFLRQISQNIVEKFEIVGECNVQLALSPKSLEYRVIEVNARLSRSSALASKATGYPIAFIAAKVGLGYALPDLENKVTKKTCAFFEPALDYVVIKIPRWDLQKFRHVPKQIGPEMKSVGEVMAIGRTFEETLQKAVRMLEKGFHGVVGDDLFNGGVEPYLRIPNEKRIIAAAEALDQKWSIEKLSSLMHIDAWFLQKIARIVGIKKQLQKEKLTKELLLEAKQTGFSDWQISSFTGKEEIVIRTLRKKWDILPKVKQIDTMAAEWPAQTNYLYTTYNAASHDIEFPKRKAVIILGSGAYRIGSSVEFDWCCVQAGHAAQKLGYETIMINYNPETVSTDFDECDRLYFEELSPERVEDIYELENPEGMIVSMGGQIPNNIAFKCHAANLKILGTNPQSIDRAEDRAKFSKLLDELDISQPAWRELSSIAEAKAFAQEVSYPVLIRPSYVLSGEAMVAVFQKEELEKYLRRAARVSPEYPVVISKFFTNAREIELDAVAAKGEIISFIVSEHVELAGTHSGDSFVVTPAQRLDLQTLRAVTAIAKKIAKALEITGPFNIQFLAKEHQLRVIECNLRSSRSFPFVSKVHNVNLAALATRAILGEKLKPQPHTEDSNYVGVKAPQFSFSRLKGADPLPTVDMASTGEVGCLGATPEEAFLKSAISVGTTPPKKNILVSISGDKQRYEMLSRIGALAHMGYALYGTENTVHFFSAQGISMELLHKMQETKEPNVGTYMQEGKIDFLISIPPEGNNPHAKPMYNLRRAAVDLGIPLLTNTKTAKLYIRALQKHRDLDSLAIREWHEYR